MKRSKKVLSLVLALSMFLGMMTFAHATELPYTDYFNTEREFEDQSWNPVFDNIHVFIYEEDGIYGTIPGFVPGYLYKRDFESEEKSLLVGEQVTAYDLVEERIYYSSGNSIYSIDRYGNDCKTILTANGRITNFIANETLVFYVVGDVLYRYYAPSGAVDWIANAPGIVDFEPLSNVEVAWWAEELSAGEPIQSIHAHGPQDNQPEPAVMPRYYITSTLAGETEELGVEEWLDRRTTENTGDIMQSAAPQAAAANLSFNIRNVILPKPGYEHGTSYTYNGSPCNPAHPNTVTSNCRRYNNSAQCAAFGWEIIDYLFSTRPNPVTYPTTKPYLFTDLATVRIFLDYTCAGASARVRYYKDNYGEHGHTIILANIDSNNYRVVVYDANWDNRCGIRLLELTYQEFANQMKNAINYRTLPHSYSSYTATANLHYKACIHCHSAHINTNSHTYVGGRCSVCGYLYRG